MFHCYLLFFIVLSYIIHNYFHYPAVIHIRFAFAVTAAATRTYTLFLLKQSIMILYKFSITHQVDDVRATGLCPAKRGWFALFTSTPGA